METISDIVAEMRRGTKLPGYWRSCDLNKILAYHADLIEAAWRREKDEIEANALAVGGIVESARHSPCNAAAIRDALESVRNWCINKLGGASFQVAVEGLLQIVDKAMTAPARNCDRFADEDDAFAAWHDSLNDGDVVSVRNAFRWLLAPAAERKGGGDGR